MPRIDDEFKGLIPPLSAEEYGQLEENLTEYGGARDPLVVWKEADILLDGHNRLEICERLGLPYAIAEISLPDRDAAADWIDKNQLGRRNLAPLVISQIRGRCYNRQKKAQGEHSGNQYTGLERGQNDPFPKTADRLAEQFGVSPATVKRDGQFAAAVESLKPVIPDIETRVMAGDVPSKKAVMETAQTVKALQDDGMPVEEIKKVAHVANNSGNNEWYTPPEYIEAARLTMGAIDCDPASSAIANETVGAAQFFTAEDDGLKQVWRGRVWMNPPYALSLIANFCERLAAQFGDSVTEACVLTNNATETAWFNVIAEKAAAVCFIRRRIRFLNPQGEAVGAPLQGQVVLYLGKNPAAFAENFSQFGLVFYAR